MTPEARQTASDKITALCCESKVVDGVTVYRLRGTNDIWDATPPDWFNDLNAMHSAEETIFHDEIAWHKYRDAFWLVEGFEHHLHATASQRFEAFLRTLNLWTDTKGI